MGNKKNVLGEERETYLVSDWVARYDEMSVVGATLNRVE